MNRRADGFFLTMPDAAQSIPAAAGEMFDFTGAGDTAVAAIAGSLAVGHDLALAVRIAALAMAVSATQPGMAVASAADLLAVLTPQGRALRKIVEPAAAADQMAHWRRGGLRTGLLTTAPGGVPVSGLDELRRECDRLVLAVETGDNAGSLLADAASLTAVDLVCQFAPGSRLDLLALLRPDVLLDDEADERTTALVLSWGGQVGAAQEVEV